MKIFILTDNESIPYEGVSTSVKGVFTSETLALEAMKTFLAFDGYQSIIKSPRNKAKFIDGMPAKDSYGSYYYYNNYDSNWFEIIEATIDNIIE